MSGEPWIPLPSPQQDGPDSHPPRCPECRSIIDMRSEHEGWCPEHGMVMANYSFEDLKFEIAEEEGSEL